ncbi:hypothetical protein A6I85_23515 [Prescottella equi]|nr:hypothetical protein A6I85_23515 [Prescottella equi]ORM10612.1 hypothetical protein A5N77_14890 [Prescottella equi]
MDAGAEPATARSRQLAVKRFSAWLRKEDEIADDHLLGVRPPRLDVKVVNPLTDDQLKALVKACQGKDMRSKRDEALIRLMAETGMRAGEVVGLRVGDVSLSRGTAVVLRGKGGKGRVVPFGPQTGRAIDRYVRARAGHLLSDSPALWVGDRGRGFTYYGLHKALRQRAEIAGVEHFHPHLLRHTAASRWLARDGSEGGLMAVAGWSRRDMLDRYTAATASERAATEARQLGLGDF